mmetsp:Transcript_11208/g.34313  ORF Transcript_11208/g.34313 Transcript_11208/m.34313 type:complete len:81 (+) Transcript_11208:1294-1536(+)
MAALRICWLNSRLCPVVVWRPAATVAPRLQLAVPHVGPALNSALNTAVGITAVPPTRCYTNTSRAGEENFLAIVLLQSSS